MARQSSPFAYPYFRYYWGSRLMATLAQMMMVVIIGWQVYDIARRNGMAQREASLQLGLIGVVQFVPLLLLTPVVGWVADRLDRRWIARGSILLQCGGAALLAVAAFRETTTLPVLFVVAGLLGVARAFAQPALQALSPNLVPADVLPAAIAVSSIAWQAGEIFGPPAGGLLYAIHAWVPYAASALLFLLAFGGFMLIGPVPRSRIAAGGSPWSQMVDGLRYVLRNRLVLGAISLDLFAVLLGGATAMLPVFARDILHVGPAGMGLLRMAPAAGAVAIGIWFSIRPLRTDVGTKMLAAVIVFGAATVVFGLSRSMPLSLVCLALLGAADMLSVFVRQTLIQLYTPDAMRGRVGAVSTLFISGSNELGEAESGFLAAAIGPVAAVVGGGIGAILVTLLWARWFPEIRRARTFDPPATLESTALQERVT